MHTNPKKELFHDYWSNNKGTFYKKFDFSIANRYIACDIYWADPNIIFYDIDAISHLPLARLAIPVVTNHPHSRIFLHNNLIRKYKEIFEYVITHEIGHLCFYDLLGVRSEFTYHELEALADLFSCIFFMKYRNIEDQGEFNRILNNALDLQAKIYKIPVKAVKHIHNLKKEEMERLVAKSEASRLSDNHYIFNIANSIEPILDALGDIFNEA